MVQNDTCPYCEDVLHGFIEELEDGSIYYVTVCPTCYRYIKWIHAPSLQSPPEPTRVTA